MATALSSLVSTGLSTGSGSSSSSATGGFVGLGQGINVTSFVQAAEADAQANITNVQNEQTAVNAQSSDLATIASDLTALQTATNALQDPLGALADQTATSSDPNLSATATSEAQAGTHTIAVTSLATTSSYYSDPVATSSTPLGTGDTIAISVGGVQQASVTVTSSNNTLAQIASAINNQTTGVQASVITDANGARLAIVSTTSGLPGALTITGTLHSASGNAIDLHQAVAGTNAVLTVDGVPISSASNTVSGVINGVTLSLLGPTSGTGASLTVAPDSSGISAAINTFVSAYNTAITAINGQFQAGATPSTTPPLETDSSLSDAQAQLLSATSYSVTGSGGSESLASIGISTNDDGTLTVDSDTLASALATNYSGVQNFFQAASTGFAQNISNVLNNLVGGSGELTLDAQGYTAQSNDLTQQISDLQANLAVQTTNLTATYAQVNDTLEELPLLQSQLSQQLSSLPT
jgi:flagellar hook-associated protein 2